LATYADGYDIPVLVTRNERNEFTEPVATVADHHLECEQTRMGPRVVGEDFETLVYPVDDGAYYQTTFAYWQQLLAARATQVGVEPTTPAPSTPTPEGVGTGVTADGETVAATADPARCVDRDWDRRAIAMGRTNPTYRDALRAIEERWAEFRRALRRRDQPRFDRVFEYAREHADASGLLNHQNPLLPALLSIDPNRRAASMTTRNASRNSKPRSQHAMTRRAPTGREPVTMPFSIDFLDDGRILEWEATADGTVATERDDYTPCFYVGARDPETDLDLTTSSRCTTSTRTSSRPRWLRNGRAFDGTRRPFRGRRRPHRPRHPTRPASAPAVGLSSRGSACFKRRLRESSGTVLETGADPTPASELSTLRLSVPVTETSNDVYGELSVAGDTVTGSSTDILTAVQGRSKHTIRTSWSARRARSS